MLVRRRCIRLNGTISYRYVSCRFRGCGGRGALEAPGRCGSGDDPTQRQVHLGRGIGDSLRPGGLHHRNRNVRNHPRRRTPACEENALTAAARPWTVTIDRRGKKQRGANTQDRQPNRNHAYCWHVFGTGPPKEPHAAPATLPGAFPHAFRRFVAPAARCANALAFEAVSDYRRPRSAPVAQLDRAPDYESGGHGFESCRARHSNQALGVFLQSDNPPVVTPEKPDR